MMVDFAVRIPRINLVRMPLTHMTNLVHWVEFVFDGEVEEWNQFHPPQLDEVHVNGRASQAVVTVLMALAQGHDVNAVIAQLDAVEVARRMSGE